MPLLEPRALVLRRLAVPLLLVHCLGACAGSVTAADSSAEGSTDAALEASVDGTLEASLDAAPEVSADVPSANATGCPANEPVGGQVCGLSPSALCQYAVSVDLGCWRNYRCEAGLWLGTNNSETFGGCASAEVPPATPPSNGGSCTVRGQRAVYSSTLCLCTDCIGGGIDSGVPCTAPLTWHCGGLHPPFGMGTSTGCPATIPPAGTACSREGTACAWGPFCAGSARNCTGGSWRISYDGCA